MSKGLEAWERIKNKGLHLYMHLQEGYEYQQDLSIIEKELEDYETFKTGLILGNMSIVDNKMPKALAIIVNIIKEHHVTAYFLERTKAQEEYDLLKEVLL